MHTTQTPETIADIASITLAELEARAAQRLIDEAHPDYDTALAAAKAKHNFVTLEPYKGENVYAGGAVRLYFIVTEPDSYDETRWTMGTTYVLT